MSKQFLKILVIYFMIMVAANLIHPITPEFIRVREFPNAMFGVALAMMNLTNFLFSNFWGTICDQKGRKKVMMIGCMGYAIGQLWFGFSYDVVSLVSARLLAGFFTGAFTVPILAYISDISVADEVKKNFSVYATLTAVAGAIGYYIGGYVGSIYLLYAFYLQVTLLLISVCGIFFTVKEIKVFKGKLSFQLLVKSLNPLQVFFKQKIKITVMMMLFVSFFVYFANTMFDNSFSYYLSEYLKLKPAVNGMIKAFTGIVTLLLNVYVIHRILKKTHVDKMIQSILIISITLLFCVMFSLHQQMFFIASILFYIVFLCVIPLQQSLIMENIDDNMRGSASGMINAVRAIAGVVASLLAGFVYGKLPEITFPYVNMRIAFPIMISILCMVIALLLLNRKRG